MPGLILTLTACLLASPGNRLVSREMGIALDLPPHPVVIQQPGGAGESVFLIREGRSSPQWSIRVEGLTDLPSGLQACLDHVLTTRAPDAEGPALEPIELDLHGHPALMQWVKRPMPGRGTVLMGLLVAARGHGHALLVTAVTVPDAPQATMDALDQAFASARLLDQPPARALLNAAMGRGEMSLKSLSEQKLRSLVGRHEVLRIHNPNAAEGGEIAYGTLSVEAAPRSALQTEFGGRDADGEDGLLVTTHLRFAEDPAAGRYTDRLQQSWMSWDLSEEVWVDRATTREADLRRVSTEIGLREPPSTGVPRGQVIVVRQEGGAGVRDTTTFTPESSWLPRGLRWLVWDLAPDRPTEPVAWQTWDDSTAIPRTTIRTDLWEGPRRCWSWSGLTGLPTGMSHGQSGRWTRATLPSGVVVERSDEETVTSKWKAAGLQLR